MLSRRSLFVLSGASLFAAACGKPEIPKSCAKTPLSSEAQKMRDNLKYVDSGPEPAKYCDVCVQYRPGASGQCGKCSLLEGPIHPEGTCTAFSPKG
jgi:hypothetical protein